MKTQIPKLGLTVLQMLISTVAIEMRDRGLRRLPQYPPRAFNLHPSQMGDLVCDPAIQKYHLTFNDKGVRMLNGIELRETTDFPNTYVDHDGVTHNI